MDTRPEGINKEKLENIEKAKERLSCLKRQASEMTMHTWKTGGLEISYRRMDNLRRAVETLGYQWEDGKLIR